VSGPLEVYSAYQQRLAAHEYARLGEVVDLQGYTENCLGLTGWTTGFEVALHNYSRNILSAFTDLAFTTEDMIEGDSAVAIRSRAEGTHSGTFLGLPPTGRRVAWDVVAMVHISDGRLAGQWIQMDLWGVYQQLTASTPEAPGTVGAKPEVAWAHSAR
jgi:predicted ester cyclase